MQWRRLALRGTGRSSIAGGDVFTLKRIGMRGLVTVFGGSGFIGVADRAGAGQAGLAHPRGRAAALAGLPPAPAGRRRPDRDRTGQRPGPGDGGTGADRRGSCRLRGRRGVRERQAAVHGRARRRSKVGRGSGGATGHRPVRVPVGHWRQRRLAFQGRPRQGRRRGGGARGDPRRGGPAAVAGVRPGGQLLQQDRPDGGAHPGDAGAGRGDSRAACAGRRRRAGRLHRLGRCGRGGPNLRTRRPLDLHNARDH